MTASYSDLPPYYQYHLLMNEQDIPLMELCIEQLDVLSVSYLPASAQQQDIYEPELGTAPKWQYTEMQLLLEQPLAESWLICWRDQLKLDIKSCFGQKIAHQDWQKNIIAATQPIYLGDRLVIGPEEHLAHLQTGHIKLRLTPGLAFGTGTHPTTHMCLEWLVQQSPVDYLVDYGCGSGILAIAALLLGSKTAAAVDIDPQALTATNNNRLNNGLTEQQLHTYLPNALPQKKTQWLIANILAKPLLELASTFADLVAPQGKLLLTGILVEQKALLYNAYNPWFKTELIAQQDNWALLEATRKLSAETKPH